VKLLANYVLLPLQRTTIVALIWMVWGSMFLGYFSNFRNSIAKPFFELFVVFLVFLFVIYTNLNAENVSAYLPTIGIFLFASYRLIPSLSRIVSSLQRIQLNFSSVSKINNDFTKFRNLDNSISSDQKDETFRLSKNIEFKKISFTYKENPKLESDFIIRLDTVS
jgi:ABC-type multidrug transport system fused ATPase/permease subunit